MSLQQGAIGSTIQLTIVSQSGTAVDISTATLTSALFMRAPSGVVLTKTPSFSTDGTDGIIVYDTISGDLSEHGQWKVQFRLVMGGDTIPSTVVPIQVDPNIFP